MRGQAGQATIEWLGLTLLTALLTVAMVAAASGFRNLRLVGEISERLVCAVRLQVPCRHDPELIAGYDAEIAGLLREHAPLISYEQGMRSLPVDFRECRSPDCADGTVSGRTDASLLAAHVTGFTHVVDCRKPADPVPRRADCSGGAAGNIYLQYWLYYPDSASLRGIPVLGERGFHLDDWESYQVKIGRDGKVFARASSHNGYNGLPSIGDWASDTSGKLPGADSLRRLTERLGLRERGGWSPVVHSRSLLLVAGGSHAGRAGGHDDHVRWTPPAAVRLRPIERFSGTSQTFAITPPWRKRVYLHPEYVGTD